MIRAALRCWLGIPSRSEIREQILREIDADAVWRSREGTRLDRDVDRRAAIALGKREDTRG